MTRLSSTVWADVGADNPKQTPWIRTPRANARLKPEIFTKQDETLALWWQRLPHEESHSRWRRMDIASQCSLEMKRARDFYSEVPPILLHRRTGDFSPDRITILAVENVINAGGQAKTSGELAGG